MLSRRAALLVPGALLSLCVPQVAHAAASRELFTLARNTNANVVKYAVRLAKDGRLDAQTPIEAYWLMLAENGHREELTWTERQLAYGFSVSAQTAESCVLHLSACSDRALRVRAVDGSFRAELKITQQLAFLQRIYVHAEGALLPSVRYVEISGVTAAGQRISERIVPRAARRVSRF